MSGELCLPGAVRQAGCSPPMWGGEHAGRCSGHAAGLPKVLSDQSPVQDLLQSGHLDRTAREPPGGQGTPRAVSSFGNFPDPTPPSQVLSSALVQQENPLGLSQLPGKGNSPRVLPQDPTLEVKGSSRLVFCFPVHHHPGLGANPAVSIRYSIQLKGEKVIPP